MAILLALYGLNRFCLVPRTGSRLLAWHGADALAGGVDAVSAGAFAGALRPPAPPAGPAWGYLLGCGLFWEYVTPLYLPRSVSDPRDILAVWLGGTMMLVLLRRPRWTRPPANK